jgi:hypothetical protein
VPFTGAGEGAVQFDARPLESATDEPAREEPDAAGAGGVAAARPNHDGTDDIEQGDHQRLARISRR